jgi:ATP-binding cassette subfamily C protein
VLSGGQRQRVALARALYGDPFLVVLDEPNANLDGAGDEALNRAILAVRERGGIVVVITHRPAALGQVDLVAILEAGRLKTLGPRDEVLQGILKRAAPAPAPRPAPLREVG